MHTVGPARLGLSPAIGLLILVSLSVLVSIAVAGWLMGSYTLETRRGSLFIYSDSYADYEDDLLCIYLENMGMYKTSIMMVEALGMEYKPGSGVYLHPNVSGEPVVEPGGRVLLVVAPGVDILPGDIIVATIYTSSGDVFMATLNTGAGRPVPGVPVQGFMGCPAP